MAVKIDRKNHRIDATNKAIGRIASEAARLLIGKNKPSYRSNIDNGDFVIIENALAAKFTGKKMDQKVSHHFSGFPGGLKTAKLSETFYIKPAKIYTDAVYNMLPKNKLRAKRIKRLTIK